MKLFLVGGLMLAAAQPTLLAAATLDIPRLAAAYGARPTARQMQMSPSGDRILYFTPTGTQGLAVVAADIATGATKILLSSEKATIVPTSCGWKSEARVICRVYLIRDTGSERLTFMRAMSIAADGSSRINLGQRGDPDAVQIDQQGASVIDWLPDDPDHVLMQVNMAEKADIGTNIKSRGGGITVQKVDVNTGRMTPVERASPLVMGYDSDNQGRVRFMELGETAATGYVRDRISYMVRGKAGKEWRKVAGGTMSGLSPWRYRGFDETGDSIFVIRDKDGHGALFRDPVDPGGAGGLVFADPRVDIDGVLRIGKYQRPVAATYAVEGSQYHFFDPVLERRVESAVGGAAGQAAGRYPR